MILISSCLLGVNCKYNGKNNYNILVEKVLNKYQVLPLCAEQLGGLPTPRVPSEIKKIGKDIKVINKNNEDVTSMFFAGAQEVLNLVKKFNIKKAILKEKSPSCGKGFIYSGNFDDVLVKGNGILANMLIENGVKVYTLEEFIKAENLD